MDLKKLAYATVGAIDLVTTTIDNAGIVAKSFLRNGTIIYNADFLDGTLVLTRGHSCVINSNFIGSTTAMEVH